jgi:ubiquinone/menaquinone biosynthesis C-methylase UbiE
MRIRDDFSATRPTTFSAEHGASTTQRVAQAYDRWAETYDSQDNHTSDLDAVILRTHGPSIRGRAVLELGCGTGKNTEWLAANCRTVTALDVSEGMLAAAGARVSASHVSFVQHDLLNPWPVADGSMDLVVGNLVLEHIHDLAPMFRECARVLRRGGKLYVSELHPARQLRGAQAHFTDVSTGDVVYVPAFTHTISEYVNSAISAGFTLRHMGEWLEEPQLQQVPPRLLTLQFVRTT